MNSAVAPGLPVILNTKWQNQQPLSSTNTQIVSMPFNLATANTASIQVFTDGGCAVNYTFQVTNLPANIGKYGVSINGLTTRDDTFTSKHWDTTPNGTGTIAAGGAAVQTLLLPTSVFRHGRLLFAWGSGGSGNIVAVIGTTEA